MNGDGDGDGTKAVAGGHVASPPPPEAAASVALPLSDEMGVSAAVAPTSSSAATPSMGMFYGDANMNILEEGDEHAMGAEEFADMAMGGMDMSMELNALQIRAFLARSEQQHAEASGLIASAPGLQAPLPHHEQTQQPEQQTSKAVESIAERHKSTRPASAAGKSGASAYETSKAGVVHYSRREDKMRALQAHPVVASVASDGRSVSCKCGRIVRLNPPWYIHKFEQHVASRNCTFLRSSSRPLTKSGKPKKRRRTSAMDESSETREKDVHAPAVAQMARDADLQQEQRGSTQKASSSSANRTVQTAGKANTKHESSASAQSAQSGLEQADADAQVTTDKADENEVDEDVADKAVYGLQSIQSILRRDFGAVVDGKRTVVAPPATAPEERIQQFETAMQLRENPSFSRITPDGRFVECKCSRLVLLSSPWHPRQFFRHVMEKQGELKKRGGAHSAAESSWQVPPKKLRRANASASPASASTPREKPPFFPVSTTLSATAQRLVQANKKKKSFPREIHWDDARSRGVLPCPGLRDDRMSMFVALTVQLTGGSRPRQKVAQDLFPHLFPVSSHAHVEGEGELDVDLAAHKKQLKLYQQLLDAEKLLLHDVIEGEALWFVDKDGSSVRSLECRGTIEAVKNEERCPACEHLRGNSALWAAAWSAQRKATMPGRPRNPVNRKFCTGRVCSLLEAEFDMSEPHARLLRDLSLAEVSEGSELNTWMEMAAMGLAGAFDSHPALLGLAEAMVRLKDKERRGVGLQNMSYSAHLDAFMRALSDLSLEACELFQRHLGGRKQRQILATTPTFPTKRKLPPPVSSSSVATSTGDETTSQKERRQEEQHGGEVMYDAADGVAGAERTTGENNFAHLLDPSVVGLGMPPLSIGDIQDVDMGAFPTSTGAQHPLQHAHHDTEEVPPPPAAAVNQLPPSRVDHGQANESQAANGGAAHSDSPAMTAAAPSGSASKLQATSAQVHELEDTATGGPRGDAPAEWGRQVVASGAEAFAPSLDAGGDGAKSSNRARMLPPMPSDHVPCTGLRDENVQAYVANAVQIVGGSRPRYVIARELFPRVFDGATKVRIVDKLSDGQRLMLQDAVFSECLWRVDKEGHCVRSLRCKRFVPVSTDPDDPAASSPQNLGVCRACRELRTVPNFRSVLSRSKVPKKLENIKYVPSVYTESDPFLRKLSKNAAFRGMYQIVQRLTARASPEVGENATSDVTAARKKQVTFWLRFARMGVFGHFRSHPVFEGLMQSMVEVKDKERRGVGKQNMQYSRELDDFLHALAQLSTEAFELFATQFCGRTLRSQKVKRRRTGVATQLFDRPMQSTINSAAHHGIREGASSVVATSAPTSSAVAEASSGQEGPTNESLAASSLAPHQHQHYLMPPPDDLLSGRGMSSEESQRFMDRMLDEVRLSVSREMQLVEEDEQQRSQNAAGNGDAAAAVGGAHARDAEVSVANGSEAGHLDPDTYLDDDGVLTTEI